ncbi:MAG: polyphosphate polymerase domain-containing protein [Crocinitomicaceae bacterium]
MVAFDNEIEKLETFSPISLAEMDEVKLMNRTDTKFVFKRSDLSSVLEKLSSDYSVLKINDNLISSYKTLYFDTLEFGYYLDHHNGRGNRFKVRIRNYTESNLFFLEIKNKYKGRTDKKRIKLNDFETSFSADSRLFVDSVIDSAPNLEAKLWNNFSRITLVNHAEKERLTLDLNLSFDWNGRVEEFDHIVIAELKQENVNRNSKFYQMMKSFNISSNSISKYCIGAVSLNPGLKYNSFKSKTLLINKLLTL